MFIPFFMERNNITFFQTSGNCPDSRQFLKSKVTVLHINGAHSLSIFTQISPCPWALLGLRNLIIWKITSEEMLKVFSLSSVKWFQFEKSTLLLLIPVYLASKIFIKYVSLGFKLSYQFIINQQERDIIYLFPIP